MIVFIAVEFTRNTAVSRGARQNVRALLKAGHSVTVITDFCDNSRVARMMNRFKKQLDIVVIRSVHLPVLYLVGMELSFAFQTYFLLKRLNKKEGIELIISQVSGACFGVVPFAKTKNIPTFFIIRALIGDRLSNNANAYDLFTTIMYKMTNRYALTKIKYFIAVSEYIKKKAIEGGADQENIYVLHNPVDNGRFFPKSNISKNVDLLFIGRLSLEKGISLLINSSAALSKNTKILVIGDGYLRKQLEKRALNQKCNIKFIGWVDNDMIPYYIRRSKVLLVPSLSEAQGRIVLEAMACGVPVIGSKVGGIPEMLKHGENGWLVPFNKSKKLAETATYVLENDEIRKKAGWSALETAKQFSISQFEVKLVKIYEEAISGQ